MNNAVSELILILSLLAIAVFIYLHALGII